MTPQQTSHPAPGSFKTFAARARRRLLHEAKRLFGIFLYLLVMFGMLLLYEALVLAKYNIGLPRYGLAFVNAGIMAKVILIAEDLNLARRLENGPLAYSVMYKSVVFAIVSIGAYLCEEILVGVVSGKTVAESIPRIGGGSVVGVISVGVIITVALVPYFAFRELTRVVGPAEIRHLFFKRRTGSAA